MELDERIIKGKKPLTCFDTEQAQNFVGKKCYLTNDISIFSDLDSFKETEGCSDAPYVGVIDRLTNINKELGMVFDTTFLRWKFCLPCEWVKTPEKKYRAFTIKEFIEIYSVGNVFQIRHKQEETTETCVQYVGYKISEQKIYLGITDFTLDELFENFEMIEPYGDTWIPFGSLTLKE